MVVTIRIAIVLCVWSVYAQSGTGVIRVLPFLKPGFVGIMATYIARAIVFAPAVLTTGAAYAVCVLEFSHLFRARDRPLLRAGSALIGPLVVVSD
jgi:hypothetical protein